MIFVTVGTQLPFDRLIKYVDKFAGENESDICAQIGNGNYFPINIRYKDFYTPDDMDSIFNSSELIVSHAGMGSIINCLRAKKKIIVIPRLSKYGEHRNDHQLDTIASLSGLLGVYVARSYEELAELIEQRDQLATPVGLHTPERKNLCEFLLSLL